MATIPLTEPDIAERLAKLSGWERSGDEITKTFKLTSYTAGLAFASAVGTLAEGFDHHPTLVITWRKVKVSFTTHDAGSKLSHKDFMLAEAVDALKYPKAAG